MTRGAAFFGHRQHIWEKGVCRICDVIQCTAFARDRTTTKMRRCLNATADPSLWPRKQIDETKCATHQPEEIKHARP